MSRERGGIERDFTGGERFSFAILKNIWDWFFFILEVTFKWILVIAIIVLIHYTTYIISKEAIIKLHNYRITGVTDPSAIKKAIDLKKIANRTIKFPVFGLIPAGLISIFALIWKLLVNIRNFL